MLPGVAAGIGSVGVGLLGGLLGGSDPVMDKVNRDTKTIGAEEALKRRADRSQQDFANTEMQGIDPSHGLLGSPVPGSSNEFMPHEVQSALDSRQSKMYSDEVGRLARQANIHAASDKLNANKAYENVKYRRENIEAAIKNQVEAQELAHQEARNSVFAKLFGGAGGIIGQGLAQASPAASAGGGGGTGSRQGQVMSRGE